MHPVRRRCEKMKIEILPHPSGLRVSRSKIRRFLRWLIPHLDPKPDRPDWASLTLALHNDAEMRACHHASFGSEETTDVISFLYAPLPGETNGAHAEIFVNVDEARRQGVRRRRSSPVRELALYIAHGCHHLTGADDNTPARRKAMVDTERRWVRRAERNGILQGMMAETEDDRQKAERNAE